MKTVTQRISLWFGAALIIVLTLLAIGLVHWYSGSLNRLYNHFRSTVADFSEGVQLAIEGKLKKFVHKTDESDLATLLGASTEKDLDTEGSSITTGATGASSPDSCRLLLGRSESQTALRYAYSGLSRNQAGEFERATMTLEARIDGDIKRLAAVTDFDAIFVADKLGAVLVEYPEPARRVPHLENIKAYRDSKNDTIRIDGEDYAAFFHDIPFRDSFKTPDGTTKSLNLPQQCIDDLSLQALGLIRKSKVTEDAFQWPHTPVFVLCFVLLLVLLSFPFLQLFAPRPAEPFSRVDGVLLLICGTGLIALLVTGLLFLTSFSKLQSKEDKLLDSAAAKSLKPEWHQTPRTCPSKLADALAPRTDAPAPRNGMTSFRCAAMPVGSFEDNIDDDTSIRRLIDDAGPAQHSEIDFAGHFYRIRIEPPEKNLRLVVLRDQEPLRSARVQVALFCLLLFALYVLAVAASLAIFLGYFPRLKYPFFWPLPELGGAYAVLTAGYLAMLILAGALSLHLAPQWMIFTGFLVPLVVLIATITGLVRWRSPRGALSAKDRKNQRWLAVAAVVMAATLAFLLRHRGWMISGLAAALPITLWMTFQIADRRSRTLGRKWGTPLYAVAVVAIMMLIGGLPAFCCYEAAFVQEIRLLDGWTAQLERAAPPLTLESAEKWSAGIIGGFGAQAFNQIYEQLRLRPSLNNQYTRKTNNLLLRKWSPANSPERPVAKALGLTSASPLVWLAFIATFAATAWLLVASVRRLFGPEFSRQGPGPKSLKGRQILWVGPSGDWVKQLAHDPDVLEVELNGVDDFLKIQAQALKPEEEQLKTLLIPDFGARWLDDSVSQIRYEALKKLVGEWQGGLWLVSEVAPEELALPTGAKADPAGVPHELVAALQDEFTLVHGRDDRREIKKLARMEPEAIWRSLPHEERLTLLRIATSGYLAQGEHAQSLVAYGALSANPAPQIATPELRRLVLARRREVQEEKSAAPTPTPLLSRLRPILAIGFLVVLAFLYLTQADWFQGLSGVIAGIAAALGFVSQIGSWLRFSGAESAH